MAKYNQQGGWVDSGRTIRLGEDGSSRRGKASKGKATEGRSRYAKKAEARNGKRQE